MSITINNDIMCIELPNSEAPINAQHKGIKDRTVNAYYLSNRYNDVFAFLNELKGNFYIDYLRVYNNMFKLINKLLENNLENAFKTKLLPQKASLSSIKYTLEHGESLVKIDSPTINDQRKYIKFPINSNGNDFRDLFLGDLVNIIIKKLGYDTFIIYIEENNKFNELISSKQILSWIE